MHNLIKVTKGVTSIILFDGTPQYNSWLEPGRRALNDEKQENELIYYLMSPREKCTLH